MDPEPEALFHVGAVSVGGVAEVKKAVLDIHSCFQMFRSRRTLTSRSFITNLSSSD